jgi:hypothetical protein
VLFVRGNLILTVIQNVPPALVFHASDSISCRNTETDNSVMAPKKGVSFDDKRLRLLEIFARAEVFTLKEIEKIGSKEKGIVEQTIKDVLQTLVDDGLVETDKIGAGNCEFLLLFC